MKIMKKHLSLLLAVSFLLGLVVVSTAITVSADPTALLELDFSNFEAVAYSAATEAGLYGQTSGVTASGTWAASTSLGFSKRPSENQLTKGSIHNSDNGYTYYIDTFDEKTWSQSNQVSAANNYAQHLSNMQFKNNNLESTSNTFSFWVDADYSDKWKQIFAYRVDYNGSSVESFDLGLNYGGVWNALSDPVNASPTDRNVDTFTPASGWKHVVVTNPMRSGGQKTMDVYINGAYVKSVTLDIPDDATINTVSCSFFSKSLSADGYWRTRDRIVPHGTLADVKVYDGVLSAQEVSDLYTAQLPRFTEAPVAQIEGYTFIGASFDYDGQAHTIQVTRGTDATEGVNIAYTCNGQPFEGATAPGTYAITATLTKDGYLPLELNATLSIVRVVADGDLLVGLDLSAFSPTPKAADGTAAPSGITASGDWATDTTLSFAQRPNAAPDNNIVTKGQFVNAASNYTYYVNLTDPTIYPNTDEGNSYAQHLTNLQMKNATFEAASNTFSFWVDVTPSYLWKEIACYRIDYDGGAAFFDLGVNADGTWNAISWNPSSEGEGKLSTPADAETGAFKVPAGFKHVVISNPKVSAGQKSIDLYINGQFIKTVTLNIPAGKTPTNATVMFFSKSIASEQSWRARYSVAPAGKLGGINVYAGAMDATAVSALYTAQLPLFSKTNNDGIVSIKCNGSDITNLNGVNAGDVIEVNYGYSAKRGISVYAAAYSEDEIMLSVAAAPNAMAIDKGIGEGTLSLTIPEGTNEVRIFEWNKPSILSEALQLEAVRVFK